MSERRRVSGYATRCPQEGLTLIELIASIVIIGIALTAITLSITTSLRRSADVYIETQAIALAQSYLDEVLGKRFDEGSAPGGIPPCRSNCSTALDFGPDGGEVDRGDFDDVDDYHNLNEGLGQATALLDANGNEREGYDNFRVQIQVRYLEPGAGGSEENLGATVTDLDNATDAKLIQIHITHLINSAGWRFSAYKSNF